MAKIETILEMIKSARGLTLYYLSLLKDVDKEKVFVCEGKELNSVHWIVCHLCWTDNFLLLKSSSTKIDLAKDWFEEYGFGSDPKAIITKPNYDEALELLNTNRAQCRDYLSTLSDEELESDNLLDMNMGGSKALKNILYHSIRHEGTHAGHLGWLCKLHGIKTV
jgi:glucose-6-phosphate isomerase